MGVSGIIVIIGAPHERGAIVHMQGYIAFQVNGANDVSSTTTYHHSAATACRTRVNGLLYSTGIDRFSIIYCPLSHDIIGPGACGKR